MEGRAVDRRATRGRCSAPAHARLSASDSRSSLYSTGIEIVAVAEIVQIAIGCP